MSDKEKQRNTKIIVATSAIVSLGLIYLIVKETNPNIIDDISGYFSNLFGFENKEKNVVTLDTPTDMEMEVI